MKNLIIIFSLIIGAFLLNNQSLRAQSEQDEHMSGNRFFIGGFLSSIFQDFEGRPSNSLFISNPATRFFDLVEAQQISDFQFNASPYLGIKLDYHRSLGIIGSFGVNRVKYLTTDNNDNLILSFTEYSIGAFYRNDFNITDKLIFFFQPNISYSRDVSKIEENNDEREDFTRNTFDAFANIGARMSINEKWSFIVNISTIRYSYQSLKRVTFPTEQFDHNIDYGINLTNLIIGVERSF